MSKTFMLLAGLVAALALMAAGCGGDDEGASGDEVTVELATENDSGQSGTATLTPAAEGKTTVVFELSEPPAEAQPAHIHKGTCAELDPAPAYPLTDAQDGASESEVNVSVEELTSGEFAINVHRSVDEIETYVACGDIG